MKSDGNEVAVESIEQRGFSNSLFFTLKRYDFLKSYLLIVEF
jgi:hypothetical protein